ncbi:MAG TPA: DUF192 domain-containing protein [Actinomycetota bacterium]|nr:DUF192 domain-containing protein [Actinomycetota bacterium]
METIDLCDPRGGVWRVEIPGTGRERARGLLGRDGLPAHHAMLFEGARSVHTFGMRFPIDAVVLDAELRVLAVRRLRPNRLLRPRPRGRHVLETPAGSGLRPGDRLAPAAEPGELRAGRGRERAGPS